MAAFIEMMAPLADSRSATAPRDWAQPQVRTCRPGANTSAALKRLAASFVVLLALLGAGTIASADAAAPIEAVWSFNGGEVAIQAQPDGTFVGTVVAPTKFAQCSHAVGEHMWTGIRLQQDGSYAGFHQWYFEGSACQPNPTLGPTAWRVLQAAGGARTLIVCFSSPGGSQPSITATGTRLNVTYGCFESALIGPIPAEAKVLAFRLPAARKCFSARAFPIHLENPRHDPLKSVVVKLGTHELTVLRHGRTFTTTVDLKGLPPGAFTVRVLATTVLGRRLSESRTYHTCRTKRLQHSSPKRLHVRYHAGHG